MLSFLTFCTDYTNHTQEVEAQYAAAAKFKGVTPVLKEGEPKSALK